MPPPRASGLGVPGSPAVQIRPEIRTSRCQQPVQPKTADPFALRAIPTPSRNSGAGVGARSEDWAWGLDCVAFLAAEGDEGRFRSRGVRFLDRASITSVQDAVDNLNRRSIWCPEEFCVAYAAVERAYYLVYRRGRLDSALGQLGLTREELACAHMASPNLGGAGTDRRPSLCEVSEAPMLGRPSISIEAPAATSKVVRQASMPSRTSGRDRTSAVARALAENGQSALVAAAICGGRPSIDQESCSCEAPPANGWMQPRTTSNTPASTPGAPPPVAMMAAMQGPAAVASAATLPGAGPMVAAAPYPRFSAPGPQRGQCGQAFQSYQPAPTTAPVHAQPVVTARSPSRNSCAGTGGGQRLGGPEPRLSAPPAPQGGMPPPPSRHVPSAVAVPAAGLPLANEENAAALMSPHEARGRELSDGESIDYNHLSFVENLGSGEFGQVYRGFYQGSEVCIKWLFFDDSLDHEIVLQDLAREIESFRHLNHKRLVRFIGACLEMPYPCLVTQYMPGGSLHHLLHVKKQKLIPLTAINMCLQLADGVWYLHSQNPTIVHRDLKSLNVVLDLNLNVKICDFGLTESMERTHMTKRNNGGSPRYMAPELFDSKTKITEKIDIWALGCIFVEIFGGRLPYDTINTLADLTREMLVHRRSPNVPEFIFEDIRTVILACLDFDHRVRPSCKRVFIHFKAAKKQLRDDGKL